VVHSDKQHGLHPSELTFIHKGRSFIYLNQTNLLKTNNLFQELSIDDIIKRLGEYRTNLEAERCASTIKTVIENALDTERNQIVELIEIVARKMAPPIRRYLAEGAEVLAKDSNSMDQLMMYLESSLATLYDTLNEINFQRILDGIWSELSIIMYDLIQSNLDVSSDLSSMKQYKKKLIIFLETSTTSFLPKFEQYSSDNDGLL